ncbi:MAG TPA: RidA family protein [Steroidobacteraceae bacterium]|jgi:enamine deaminase RidA (YjgF/YER057c/UK114 family)
MARRLISSGSKFEADIGYSRAVVDGEWVFVSGTTGFNYANMTIEDDVVAQCDQALKNIEAALAQAGASFEDVVRVHYLITQAEDFERCWPVVGKVFGTVRPAVVVMVVGLTDPRMKIEIEVTALRRGGGARGGMGKKRRSAARAKAAPKRKAARPKRKK